MMGRQMQCVKNRVQARNALEENESAEAEGWEGRGWLELVEMGNKKLGACFFGSQ